MLILCCFRVAESSAIGIAVLFFCRPDPVNCKIFTLSFINFQKEQKDAHSCAGLGYLAFSNKNLHLCAICGPVIYL